MPVDSATRQKAVTTAGASASRTQSAALEIASSAAMRTGSASRRPGVWGVTEDRAAQRKSLPMPVARFAHPIEVPITSP
jgi:hypothetical protein